MEVDRQVQAIGASLPMSQCCPDSEGRWRSGRERAD